MNRNLIALVIPLVLLASCSKAMTPDEKIRMLEAGKRQVYADLHRQQAECHAQAIESASTPMGDKVVSSCLEAYRISVEASLKILASFDKRIAEIEREQRKNSPFNQFDTPKPGMYDDILNGKPTSGLVPFGGKLDREIETPGKQMTAEEFLDRK